MPKIKIKKKSSKNNRGEEEGKGEKVKIKVKDATNYLHYPDFDDPEFFKTIFRKKEFHKNRIPIQTKTTEELCNPKEFSLLPHQNFLRNYISIDTPYNGVLIFFGVGVGKTCTAISIAEGFKEAMKQHKKKTLVIVPKNTRENFRKEIYNINKQEKKKRKDDIVQCTGNTYDLGSEDKYLSKEQKARKINLMINNNYEFTGYDQLVNYIVKLTGWSSGKDADITDYMKKIIEREFSNRVIVIDEIHNVKNRDSSGKRAPYIYAMIKYSKNVRLVIMSATPMYNDPTEFLYIINLLLINDGKDTIEKSRVFDKHGALKKGANEILSKAVRGYISYLKGEDPMRFPLKIYPKSAKTPVVKYDIFGKLLPDDMRMKYIKLLPCEMSKYQYDFYKSLISKHIKNKELVSTDNDLNEIVNNNIGKLENAKSLEKKVKLEGKNADENSGSDGNAGKNAGNAGKKSVGNTDMMRNKNKNDAKSFGMLKDAIFASNIIYPLVGDKIGYGSMGYSKKQNEGALKEEMKNVGGKGSKIMTYSYEKQAIFNAGTKNEAPFLDEKHLGKFSSKFAKALDYIKSSKGLVYVYSEYLAAGIIPFALALEQNGFDRYVVERERQLLEYSPNKVGGGGKAPRICYLCGKHASDKIHKTGHKWKVAKYIMLTGSQDLSRITAGQAAAIYNSEKNKYGEVVKVIIGTRVSGEGINFFRIRQVHILEPWFNMGRIEQIVGRAVRNCSHSDLKPEERNVEIFQYASTPFVGKSTTKKDRETETIDERNYRFSENKDFIIKQIERLLKEHAIDCMLNKNANLNSKRVASSKKLLTSLGEIYTEDATHKPFSRECDYQKKCDYSCAWEPKEGEKIVINTDTYSIRFANNDLEVIGKFIKKLFKMNIVYSTQDLIKLVRKKFPEVENVYIYKVLDDFINSVSTVIYDKYDREGYLLYKGNYYIFQPKELTYEKLPVYYRDKPLLTKPTDVDIASELRKDVDYNTNAESSSKNVEDMQDTLQTELMNIEKTVMANEDFCHKVGIRAFKDIIVELVIDKMSYKKHISLLKDLLIKVLDKKGLSPYETMILKYYKSKNVILFKEQMTSNRKKIKSENSDIMGFIIENKIFCMNKNLKTWKYCDPVYKSKFETSLKVLRKRRDGDKKLEKSNILGKLERINKKVDFKIIDTSKQKNALTADYKISQRAIMTGKKCKTYHANELYKFIEILTGVKLESSFKKKYLCTYIEIVLRHNDKVGLKNKKWFEGVKYV